MPVVLRRAASLYGDSDYIVMPDRRVSFRQVEAQSRNLAKKLLAAGVTKGTRVGIHMVTGPEWATAFAAATRIGALAMPLSTLYRPPELRKALRLGDIALLLSSVALLGRDHEAFLEDAIPGLAASLPGHIRIPEVPYLRSVWLLGKSSRPWATEFDSSADESNCPIEGVADVLLEAIESEVTPADPLVVVFTSGATADPKAVVHSHGTALRKTAPSADAGLNAIFGGRVLSLMPYFWIGGLQEVLAALQSGAALLTLERLDAGAALELGKREGATSVMGNPQAMRALLGGMDLQDAIATLKPVPRRPWESGHPNTRGELATGIGMTETFGAWSSVEGVECRVVDPESGEELSEGETGEFLLRGYTLMQALYKKEREDVFTAEGFYRTGDLGYLEQGRPYFKSRLSEMIKTKGANVAPAEVELVINSLPHVRISYVVGLPHEIYGQEVAAAIVPVDERSVDLDVVMAECRRHLSPYKVPAIIEVFSQEQIPQLASSKPDRRAVAALLAERRTGRDGMDVGQQSPPSAPEELQA